MISRRRAVAVGAAAWFPFADLIRGQGPCVLAPTPDASKIAGYINGQQPAFRLAETDVVTRRSFRSWKKWEWDELALAYRTLAQRSPSDPTSLVWQAALHGYYMSADDIHANWFFLPWHRAFLYFHELILRSIIRPTFRLPVWDWEEHDSPKKLLPDEFRHLPDAPVSGCNPLRPIQNNPYPITPCVAQAWLLSSDLNFLGGPSKTSRASLGPHHLIHGRVGAVMNNLAVAAADPLFYAHHGNIDRMWWHWSNNYAGLISGMPAQDRDAWHKRQFVFFDPSGKPVTLSVGELQDIRKLGYSYSVPRVSLSGITSARYVTDLFNGLARRDGTAEPFSLAGSMDALSTLLQGGLDMFPVQITIPMSEQGTLTPNRFYGVALTTNKVTRPLVIGSFALLEGHHEDHIFAAGCVSSRALRSIVSNPAGLNMVWGLFSPLGDGTLLHPQSLRNAFWNVFQASV